MKALKIAVNGEMEVVEFTTETSYKTISNAVGGWIEAVALASDITMWCNEEGKLIPLDVNHHASRLFVHAFGQIDLIAGDVILTGGADDEGNDLGLTEERISEIQDYLKLMMA